jgi:hypothetical protein
MHCYKCNESDPDKLSLKKQQRGVMTFICKACRNADARKYLKSRQRQTYTDIDPIEWEKMAKESRLRIVAHH